ncbi:capsular polysaccharide export protein [Paraburkholderia sp. JPY158]|uniref:Capsular polysaccharide export protein n=1 Tax=Paraburkholderia atlantica TaxID=2654982 RepID=A0A7W8Q173_PARAM|nr:capsular biosynthesis protein [Paraburkholderia atlantica]MBB5421880.1 capsular polysaccharide export protein [Paraburkholderia atlantica]
MSRSFLALQGTASHFFLRLAQALVQRHHSVRRINFCGGDLLYAGETDSVNFTGRKTDLSAWYSDILDGGRYSDVLLFGDCRAIHLPLHPIAERLGVRVHVFEEGYVRPNWLTLERHGVNGRSLMPRDPSWYKEHRVPAPLAGRPTGYNLYERAWHDIRYRMANMYFASRFPGYESHRPHNGVKEYAALATRFARQKRHRVEAAHLTTRILDAKRAYFLFPLQLNSDSQIVVHSPFGSVREAIECVMRSFAQHAPVDTSLLIKNHPLDTGLVEYRGFAQALAMTLDMADRLVFLEDGHLPTLLEHARGVVVVNSTVGLSALHHRRPLIALGKAVYDMPGMTWQGGLDDFWLGATLPDMNLYYTFLDYVIHHTQINGDFYTKTGIAMAVEGAVHRLEAAAHA